MFNVTLDPTSTFEDLAARGNYDGKNPNIQRNFPNEKILAPCGIVVEPVRFEHARSEEDVANEMARRGLRHAKPLELMACHAQHADALSGWLGPYWALVAFGSIKVFPKGESCVVCVSVNHLEEYLQDPTHKPRRLDLFWSDAEDIWLRTVHFLGVRL